MNQSIYSTTDIFLAATLQARGFKLDSLDSANRKKIKFCFSPTKALHQSIRAYWAKELAVEPQALFDSLKWLKSRIYSQQ